jgi:dihydrofolate reductase
MRRLLIWNLMTLDGFFEGAQPWNLDFHEYAWGEELEQLSLEQLRAADLLLFGRKTYEGMAAYWAPEEGEIADFMNSMPKIVVSTTLTKADWANTRLVSEAPEAEVARLKTLPGKDILVFGSAELCDTLLRAGLVDEYRIGLAPVVLGEGAPLFKPAPEPLRMELLEARPLSNGCVILRYRPAPPGEAARA